MGAKTTLVLFVYAAAMFLHSEGLRAPDNPVLVSVCKVTKFPHVCIDTIQQYVMGRKVDALSALKANIKGATEAFKSAKIVADGQAREKTTPPAAVNGLKVCKDSFTNAISKLQGTKQCIVDLNSFDLKALLAGVSTDVEACSKALKGLLPNIEDSVETPKFNVDYEVQGLRMISSNSLSLAEKFISSKPAVKKAKPAATRVRNSSVSRPKPGKVDHVSALKAEMQATLVAFQQAKQLVEKAIAGGATPQMETCNTTFESALEDLQKAQKAVAGGNNSVGVLLTGLNDDVQACKEGIKEIPGYKSPLPAETLEALDKLSMNCLVIMRQIPL